MALSQQTTGAMIMTVPMEYSRASEEFQALMADLLRISMLDTRHQGYTMLQAVLQVFRRRLTMEQAVDFANLLPPVLRAIFISDWNTAEAVAPFMEREAMMAEVRALRHNHNLSTPTAIEDVTGAIRLHVDATRLETALRSLPQGALAFWGFAA